MASASQPVSPRTGAAAGLSCRKSTPPLVTRHWSTISSLYWPCSPDHRAHAVTSCLVFALPTFPAFPRPPQPALPAVPPTAPHPVPPATPPTAPHPVPPAAPSAAALGVAAGATAMVCVGGSVAVSSVLAGAPVFTAEAVRYGGACLILVALARLTGRRLSRPRGAEWLWLSGIAVTGLVVFNLALVEGSRHAEPAVLGVAVACVPALLAVIGPLLEGSRPRSSLVAAALVVTCGAGLVQGLGRTRTVGVAWAAVVFGCEAAFTLLAIPVLGRHGPWGGVPVVAVPGMFQLANICSK